MNYLRVSLIKKVFARCFDHFINEEKFNEIYSKSEKFDVLMFDCVISSILDSGNPSLSLLNIDEAFDLIFQEMDNVAINIKFIKWSK